MTFICRNNAMKIPNTNKDKHLKAVLICVATVILLISLTAAVLSIYSFVLINTPTTTTPKTSEYSFQLSFYEKFRHEKDAL